MKNGRAYKRRLIDEVGKYKKKVEDQAAEIAKLRERADLLWRGYEEMSLVADGCITELALKYGEDAEGGGKVITVPLVKVREHHENYIVRGGYDEANDNMVLLVTERAKDGE